jgi:hypothetical protein
MKQPVPADQRFYEFELPRKDQNLRYRYTGTEWKDVEGYPGQILEILLRQCMLDQRSSDQRTLRFSILLGALHCWSDGDLPSDPEGTWSVLVANMRKPFEPNGKKVMPVAKLGVYHFKLTSKQFRCYCPGQDMSSQRQSFDIAVANRYVKAATYSSNESRSALSEAAAAYEVMKPLRYKDPDLTVLVCRLAQAVPLDVAKQFGNTIDDAKRELTKLHSEYQAVFGRNYDSQSFVTAMKMKSKNVGELFHQEWNTHMDRYNEMQRLSESRPFDVSVPPAGMRDSWERGRACVFSEYRTAY